MVGPRSKRDGVGEKLGYDGVLQHGSGYRDVRSRLGDFCILLGPNYSLERTPTEEADVWGMGPRRLGPQTGRPSFVASWWGRPICSWLASHLSRSYMGSNQGG